MSIQKTLSSISHFYPGYILTGKTKSVKSLLKDFEQNSLIHPQRVVIAFRFLKTKHPPQKIEFKKLLNNTNFGLLKNEKDNFKYSSGI